MKKAAENVSNLGLPTLSTLQECSQKLGNISRQNRTIFPFLGSRNERYDGEIAEHQHSPRHSHFDFTSGGSIFRALLDVFNVAFWPRDSIWLETRRVCNVSVPTAMQSHDIPAFFTETVVFCAHDSAKNSGFRFFIFMPKVHIFIRNFWE